MKHLYTAYFEEGAAKGLLELRDTLQVDEKEFEKIVDRMADDNLIYPFSGGYTYKITPAGIINTEDHGFVSDVTIKANRTARTNILDELTQVYKKRENMEVHTFRR